MTVVGLLFVAVAAQADNLPKRETMAVTHLTREDFRTKIYDFERNPGSWKFEGDKPALVDFYASWCGPCKMLAPVLEELGDEYAGRVDIYKVNVDEQPNLASMFGIDSIPTLAVVQDRHTLTGMVGVHDKADIKAMLEKCKS